MLRQQHMCKPQLGRERGRHATDLRHALQPVHRGKAGCLQRREPAPGVELDHAQVVPLGRLQRLVRALRAHAHAQRIGNCRRQEQQALPARRRQQHGMAVERGDVEAAAAPWHFEHATAQRADQAAQLARCGRLDQHRVAGLGPGLQQTHRGAQAARCRHDLLRAQCGQFGAMARGDQFAQARQAETLARAAVPFGGRARHAAHGFAHQVIAPVFGGWRAVVGRGGVGHARRRIGVVGCHARRPVQHVVAAPRSRGQHRARAQRAVRLGDREGADAQLAGQRAHRRHLGAGCQTPVDDAQLDAHHEALRQAEAGRGFVHVAHQALHPTGTGRRRLAQRRRVA
ncbi:hypothetical protein D9M68_687050 [compost metagenome]